MNLAQVAEFVLDGKVADSHKNLVVDVAVVGVDFEYGVISNFVKDREHDCGLFS